MIINFKIFERYVKLDMLVDLTKIKRYVIYKESDGYYFFDEIIKIEKNNDNLEVKHLFIYNAEIDSLARYSNDIESVFFTYLDDVEFSSDDYDEVKKYFDSIVDMYRISKKYNL